MTDIEKEGFKLKEKIRVRYYQQQKKKRTVRCSIIMVTL